MKNNSFGTLLSELRKEKGLKREELANLLGCSAAAIGNYENDNRNPDFDTLVRIADYFNTTTDYLLGRTEAKTADTDIRAVCDYLGLEEESLINLQISKHVMVSTETKQYFKLTHCTFEVMRQYIPFYRKTLNELLQSDQFVKILISCTYEKTIEYLLKKVLSLNIDEISKMDQDTLDDWNRIEEVLGDYELLHNLDKFNVQENAVRFATEFTDIDNIDFDEIDKKLLNISHELRKKKKDGESDGND